MREPTNVEAALTLKALTLFATVRTGLIIYNSKKLQKRVVIAKHQQLKSLEGQVHIYFILTYGSCKF